MRTYGDLGRVAGVVRAVMHALAGIAANALQMLLFGFHDRILLSFGIRD